jgi:acyl dehydratase
MQTNDPLPDYITAEVKAVIGAEGEVIAWDSVEAGAIRRFIQAIMDPDPIYWDTNVASERFGGVVAPPLYPMYAFRTPPNAPDPLDEAIRNPRYHGASSFMAALGLPELPIPLAGILNGGSDVEFFALAGVADRLTLRSMIEDIYQKSGRSGPLIFVRIRLEVRNQKGTVLLVNRQTIIYR